MKILLINDYGMLVGGAETMLLALRKGFEARGHTVRFFASSSRPINLPNQADFRCFGTNSRWQTLSMTANPSAYLNLRRALDSFRPDVVYVKMFLWQLSPLILPLLRNIPSIYNISTYKPICPLGTKLLPEGIPCRVRAGLACLSNHCLSPQAWVPLIFELQLWRRWRNAFDVFVVETAALKSILIAEDIQPVEVILPGVPFRPTRPALTDPPTVVFAGRLVLTKGVDVLIRAFAWVVEKIPEARLIIAGDGEERAQLEKLIEDLGLQSRVEMLGHLGTKQIERIFGRAWVQVVPSRWAEPFGFVALEAMMRGTAVIASDTGGLGETVRDGESGRLVPPGNAAALADALFEILQNRDCAERWGQAGREIAVERYGVAACASRLESIYESLLKTKANHG